MANGLQLVPFLGPAASMKHQGRVMLPLNLSTDDGPIFMNAKQYHGIIRHRKSRAKAERKHKLSKNRKFSPNSQKVMITLEDSKIRIFDGINIVHKYRGYFVVDKDSTSDKLVFNRIVTLNCHIESQIY